VPIDSPDVAASGRMKRIWKKYAKSRQYALFDFEQNFLALFRFISYYETNCKVLTLFSLARFQLLINVVLNQQIWRFECEIKESGYGDARQQVTRKRMELLGRE
jgi:hypothetical protein